MFQSRRLTTSLRKTPTCIGGSRRVQKKLEADPDVFRDELRASETALAAGRLRALNQRQAREGVERLRIDLKALRDLGIVDEHGKRVRRELTLIG